MKIHNGFISNSSSSSFILIGISVNENKVPEDKREFFYDLRDNGDFYFGEGNEGGTIKGKCLFGYFLADSNTPYSEKSLEESLFIINDCVSKMNEFKKKYNFEEEIQFIKGCISC